MADWVESLGLRVDRRDRSYLFPQELDIVVSSLGKAVEYNGDYWHSDSIILKKYGVTALEYHEAKRARSAEVGIELAFVWDDEWKTNRSEVENELQAWLLRKAPLEELPLLTRTFSTRDR